MAYTCNSQALRQALPGHYRKRPRSDRYYRSELSPLHTWPKNKWVSLIFSFHPEINGSITNSLLKWLVTLGPPCNICCFFVCFLLHQGAHCKSRLPNVGLGDPWRVLKVRIVRLADHQLLVFGDGHPIFDREPLLGFETVWCEKVPNIYSKHDPKWWLKPWWWIPMVQQKNQWDYIDPSRGDLLVALSFVKKNRGEDTPWKMNILHPKSWRFGSNVPFHLGAFEVNQSLIFRGEDTGKLWQWKFQGWNNHQIKCFFGLKLEGQSPNKPDHKVLKRDIFLKQIYQQQRIQPPPKKLGVVQFRPAKNHLEKFQFRSEHVCWMVKGSKGQRGRSFPANPPPAGGRALKGHLSIAIFRRPFWEVFRAGWCHKLPYGTTYSSRFSFLNNIFLWKMGRVLGYLGCFLNHL